ncbi:MAG: thioredoxin family protein [Azovibrio sp.]
MLRITSPLGSILPSRRTLRQFAGVVGAVVVAVGIALSQSTPALAAPSINQAAPDFSVTDTQGKTHSLASLKGKVVVLEWTNADCPFTKKHYDASHSNMQKLQKEAQGANVVWLSVISSGPGEQGHVTAEQANELTKSRGAAPAGVVLDPTGKLGHTYGAQTTPHMFVIDAQGVLRYAGGIDSIASTNTTDIPKATPYFRDALQSVIKGEPVKQPVTRPYGCSVKYTS